jgi:hypothetical protein
MCGPDRMRGQVGSKRSGRRSTKPPIMHFMFYIAADLDIVLPVWVLGYRNQRVPSLAYALAVSGPASNSRERRGCCYGMSRRCGELAAHPSYRELVDLLGSA